MSNKLFSIIKYSLLPRRCVICGEVVAINESVCSHCQGIRKIVGKTCDKCGRMKRDCDCDKSHHKPAYNAIAAPFVADNEIVLPAIHRLKFYGRQDLASPMAHQMSKVVEERFCDVDFDFVTCIPLTRRRLFKRGYNQSKLLAKAISKDLGVPFSSSLVKIFNTKPQRKTLKKQRRGNVYGAYDIKNGVDVDDKCILIVDDIKTTGSTISHCADILKMYGAKSVYAVTFGIR